MATSTVIQKSKRYSEIVEDCKNRFSQVIYNDPYSSMVIHDIPFKIRITNITVPAYSPTNVPPIGLAVIGINNYIL